MTTETKIHPAGYARVLAVRASDGSVFANVRLVTDDGFAIEFGCGSEAAADRLTDLLNATSWSSVTGVPDEATT